MKKKHMDHSFAAICFVAALTTIVLGLMGNDWKFTGTLFPLTATFAFCINVHFRLARLEKERAGEGHPG